MSKGGKRRIGRMHGEPERRTCYLCGSEKEWKLFPVPFGSNHGKQNLPPCFECMQPEPRGTKRG